MLFNYFFDVSAVIATAFFWLDLNKVKRFSRSSASFLRVYFIFNMVVGLLSIASNFSREQIFGMPLFVKEFFAFAYFLFQISLPLSAITYSLITFSLLANRSATKKATVFAPALIYVILLVANIFGGFMYEFKAGNLAYKDFYYIAYYSLTAIYLGTTVVILLLKHKNLTQKLFSLLCVSLTLSTLVVCAIFAKDVATTSFCYFIGLSLLYILVERPNNLVDPNTLSLNLNAYSEYIKNCISKNIHVTSVIVEVNDIERLSQMFGDETVKKLYTEIQKKYSVLPKSVLFYAINAKRFALTDTSKNGDLLANRVKKEIDGSWELDGHKFSITTTIVVLSYPDHYSDLSTHRRVTEYFFEQDKKTEGDSLIIIDDDTIRKYYRSLDIEQALGRAICKKSFQAQYIPIIDIKQNKVVSCEVVLRLIDDKMGYINYEDVVDIAQKNGLIMNLSEQYLHLVAKFIVHYVQSGVLDLTSVSADLTAFQLMQDDFCYRVLDIMWAHFADTKYLRLQMSENVLNVSQSMAASQMKRLRVEGVKFVCDGYGAGRSTLSYILKYPFDYVKYDKSLIRSYISNNRTRVVIDNQLYAFSGLGITTVFEGIESEEQVKFISTKKVNYAQGFYYSNALTEKDFVAFCKSFSSQKEV